MPLARALIVDDSRTAQHRLKNQLDRYDLEVDLASSAEEALGYLSYRMPTVVFMDHHMEGMDGFEALKIIKANPSTATIPVIMYTSQSDEMYAGQAHALGALDTLSKDLMMPSRIDEVLGKLNIIPTDTNAAATDSEVVENSEVVADSEVVEDRPDTGVEDPQIQFQQSEQHSNERDQSQDISDNVRDLNPPEPHTEIQFDAQEYKAQIARLFELHITDVRNQITENTKFTVRRLASEIKNALNQEPRVDDVPISVINEETRAETSKIGIVSNSLLCIILIALGAISFQIYQSQKQTDRLDEKYQQLTDLNYKNGNYSGNINPAAPDDAVKIDYRAILETLSWAMSIDMHFSYEAEPLNKTQILNLQNLVFRLHNAKYRGFIELNIHLGNFCLVAASNGDSTTSRSKNNKQLETEDRRNQSF